MKLSNIKLIDLIPLKEVDNPFAETEKAEKEKGEEKDKAPKEETPKVKIKFSVSAVKKYNNAEFTGDEGEIVSADKTGMKVNVVPDQVGIHVNYQDII